MATLAPLLPGLPGLAPVRKGRRRCAAQLTHGWTLTPLQGAEPSPVLLDFLTLWYMRVRADGEHASLWGEIGLSPSHFALTFVHIPMLVLHHDTVPWQQADGLMMIAWFDDIVPPLRARVHQWVAPAYRHPVVSLQLGHILIRHFFEQMEFHMLEGRTPVGNRAGVRYALRLGFQPVATIPYGEWIWTPEGTKTMTPVIQSQLTIDHWRELQPALRVEEEPVNGLV